MDIETDLKSCSPSNQYGYKNNKPCVLLKLNRIFKWTPDVYNFTELPEDMPESLKNHISSLSDIEVPKALFSYQNLIITRIKWINNSIQIVAWESLGFLQWCTCQGSWDNGTHWSISLTWFSKLLLSLPQSGQVLKPSDCRTVPKAACRPIDQRRMQSMGQKHFLQWRH